MNRRQRDIAVFSTSALDLFASALGAFILIVFILFPFYLNGGEDVSFEELEDLARQRRFTASEVATQTAEISALRREEELLEAQYLTALEKFSEIEAETKKLIEATAEIVVPEPTKKKPVEEQPKPESDSTGIEFSILGLATQKERVLIVVDMSGSMNAYSNVAVTAINEVLEQMGPGYEFAILGYNGARYRNGNYLTFPSGGRSLVEATPATLGAAREFARRMTRQFSGSTPTHGALLAAINDFRPSPEAIILLSDGAPDSDPVRIIEDVSYLNRRKRIEIHTVAIGQYTQEIQLVTFLNDLAQRNHGEFVGRAR